MAAMHYDIKLFFSALLGCSFQEVLYWYEKRDKLDIGSASSSKVVGYAAITGLMMLCSSAGTLIWLGDNGIKYPLKDAMLFGAAFPALFKLGVKSIAQRGEVNLGNSPQSNNIVGSALKEYFF